MVKSLIVSNEAEAEQQAFEKGRAQRFKKNKNENEKNKICLHSFFFFLGLGGEVGRKNYQIAVP